jgi:DNA-binding MarR family transcriptional regulator
MPQNKIHRFPPWNDPAQELEDGAIDEGQGLRYLVRFLNRAYTKLVEADLSEHVDITFAQWGFLRVLWDGDGLSQRELGNRVGLMANSTLAAVNIMEERGWIRRERDKKDRRRLLIFLTEKGREIHKLRPIVQQVNALAVRDIDPADITAVRQTLQQMLRNLEDAMDPQNRAQSSSARRLVKSSTKRKLSTAG